MAAMHHNIELDRQIEEGSVNYEDFVALKLFIFSITGFALIFFLWISRRYNLNDFNILFGRESSPRVNFTPTQAVSPVRNPFIVQLTDEKRSSLINGISLFLSCQEKCTVRAYWGVNIEEAYPVIFQHWQEYCGNFTTRALFENISNHTEEDKIFEYGESGQVHFQCPGPLDLGCPPRDRYPLVVVLMDSQSLDLQPGVAQVASMVIILHVKDSVCPGESHVISQYVRTPHGQPYDLKHLFVSTESSSEADDTRPDYTATTSQAPSTESAQQSQNMETEDSLGQTGDSSTNSTPTLCTVCMSSPVQVVILPCRHASVCQMCFTKLQNCPMCRNYIISFFTLGNVTDDVTRDDWDLENWDS